MNTKQLSSYAPAARRDFIAAVTAEAGSLGIGAKSIAEATVQGDVLLINGTALPASLAHVRQRLVSRIQSQGFDHTMEAVAYTWFNRLVAIRYMELHGYLDHGYRVLSHPEAHGRPEILDHATEVNLPGLDKDKAVELRLDGTKDEELYRLLLIAQCNALHEAMPFLFEKIGDETELLLPGNLLHTDSPIRQLVESIDEHLWQDIEIIGWLYQFYISEKKTQVISKVDRAEDIPAATQLFTPNWIVKYLVQNTIGAQWLAARPDSPLRERMEFYIEPATQPPDVTKTPTALASRALNPEELTLLDPACGSGHILVEAYDLFKEIYLERGYRQRDIPKLILEKNIHGLDIDERAVQLTGFALMMKALADDRSFLEKTPSLRTLTLTTSADLDPALLEQSTDLGELGLTYEDVTTLLDTFTAAALCGSLIQVPDHVRDKLPGLRALTRSSTHNLFDAALKDNLRALVEQADLLSTQYSAVVANPPYMGTRVMPRSLKRWCKKHYPDASSNLFACFIERSRQMCRPTGLFGLVTLHDWMFLTSYENLRTTILNSCTLASLVHIGFNTFPSLNSKVALGCAFSASPSFAPGYAATYVDCNSAPKSADKKTVFLQRNEQLTHCANSSSFSRIPGSPLAYWATAGLTSLFEDEANMASVARARQGMATTDNEFFLRHWFELRHQDIVFPGSDRDSRHWFPYNKGGGYRRWYGPGHHVLRYENDGATLIELVRTKYPRISDPEFVIKNRSWYFKEGLTWTAVSLLLSGRYVPAGFIFDTAGPMAFFEDRDEMLLALQFFNSSLTLAYRQILNPGLGFSLGDFENLPFPRSILEDWLPSTVERCIQLAKDDWDAGERSWDFASFAIVPPSSDVQCDLESRYAEWVRYSKDAVAEMTALEEANNRLFIEAYGLQDELDPEVPIEQITLSVNPAYRYGTKLSEEESWTRFREDTMEELVSYAIGCMMGRYSLDEPGLIYAHSGNEGFDLSRYATFPADDDGIIPITDTDWFEDDAANRLAEFISVAWDKDHLEENLTFLADNLSPKKNDSSRETIRRYLSDKFFKDHLQTYKKRPIYWLFSSGKQKAFQCLVYLHRYNEGTLARMRSEYVVPLQGKMTTRIATLEGDLQSATSTAQSKRIDKEIAKLKKQHDELLTFDEKLRHYADRRIALDLDDGVKVNYGKFGDLLAEVKTVHGKKAELA